MSVCVERCPAIAGIVERILHRIGGTSVVETSGHAEVPPCQRREKDVLQPSWQARESRPEACFQSILDAPFRAFLEEVFERVDQGVDRASRLPNARCVSKRGI